ncbi:MAG: S-layer homology domain-containing protein [Clostridia bacterium]|nr:S-layer homology domain-containing protein [Clostridia bacterium]
MKAAEGDNITYTFTTADGTTAYKHYTSTTAGNTLTLSDGVYTLTDTAAEPFMAQYLIGYQTAISTAQDITVAGLTLPVRYQYKFLYNVGSQTPGAPDAVVDFIVPASQYTNGSYGVFPERLLNGGLISLGNFGGYITVKYETPIKNDPNHKYGIDFKINGNSLGGAGFSEPGNVWVSQDGETFYLLAGSDYFDDNTIRDYEVTYIRNADGRSTYRDNQGSRIVISPDNGMYKYPLPGNYPLYNWQPGEENEILFRGPLLTSNASDPYGSAQAAFPDWGYVDVRDGDATRKAVNPYTAIGNSNTGAGSVYDISWAIDEDGNPVYLDEISYIKVSTASHIYAGAIGEKSTEVSLILSVESEASAVGVTEAPGGITVNGKNIELTEGQFVYAAPFGDSAVNVSVEGVGASAVYINNARGAERTYETAPKSGVIRVIVQEGEKEPLIYYIKNEASLKEPIAYTEALENSLGWILNNITEPTVATVGGEWSILALARYGVQPGDTIGGITMPSDYYSAYLGRVRTDAVNNWFSPADSLVHNRASTNNERIAIALGSLGIDATAFDSYNLLLPLSDLGYATWLGNNAIAYALIAFDTHQYSIPTLPASWVNPSPNNTAVQSTRANIIAALLNNEANKDLSNAGGWVLGSTGPNPDVDTTAMALQALALYYNNPLYPEVKPVVDRALIWLSNRQQDNGHFTFDGSASSESVAQVIVALCSLGIDPLTDTRFIKDGHTLLDALLSYYAEGGGFKHVMSGNVDAIANDQASYALVAYDRFVKGMNTLYDMSDAFTDGGGTGTLPINKSALNSEITRANALKASDYTAVTWEGMLAKLDAAIKVSLKDNATQAEVDTAKNALALAIAALERDSGGTGGQQWIAYISVRDDNAKAGQTRVYFAGQNLNIEPGDTVYDLLVKTGLTLSISGHPAYGLYIEAINGFGEFDDGPLSGWMYKVNGDFPEYSCALYRLKDGDRVEWVYTRDLGDDVDGGNSTGGGGTSGATPAQPVVGTTITEGQTPLAGANPFTDVKESDWFFEAVNYVYTSKLMNGTSDTLFSPNASLTRAMLVTILYRYDHPGASTTPPMEGNKTFSDVEAGGWYTDAVIWASANGIVTGYGDGKFGPNDNITLEQFAAILYRYAQKKGFDASKTTDLSAYTDTGQISAYALEAMKWANATDLITGRTQTTLAPLGTATRAEAATLLMRFIELIKK